MYSPVILEVCVCPFCQVPLKNMHARHKIYKIRFRCDSSQDVILLGNRVHSNASTIMPWNLYMATFDSGSCSCNSMVFSLRVWPPFIDVPPCHIAFQFSVMVTHRFRVRFALFSPRPSSLPEKCEGAKVDKVFRYSVSKFHQVLIWRGWHGVNDDLGITLDEGEPVTMVYLFFYLWKKWHSGLEEFSKKLPNRWLLYSLNKGAIKLLSNKMNGVTLSLNHSNNQPWRV